MNTEITIVKTISDFGHNFFKKQSFWKFYQDFGHKLKAMKKIWQPCSKQNRATSFGNFLLIDVA